MQLRTLAQACPSSRTAVRLFGAIFLSFTVAHIALGQEVETQFRLRSRVFTDSAKSLPPLTGPHPIDLDVLQVSVKKRSERLSAVMTANLASEFELSECRKNYADPIERKRCQSFYFPEAYIESEILDSIRFGLGLFQLPLAGWADYEKPAENFLPPNKKDGPFNSTQPSFKITHQTDRGEASLFVINDVTTAFPSRGEFTNHQTQPTLITEWKALHCDLCEIIQLGNYDLNHSQYLNFGIRRETSVFTGGFNFRFDVRDRKYFLSRKRSFRWSVSGNLRMKVSESIALAVQGDAFRLENRKIADKPLLANRRGEIEQNETRASIASIYKTDHSPLHYFFDVMTKGCKNYQSKLRDQKAFGWSTTASVGAYSVF